MYDIFYYENNAFELYKVLNFEQSIEYIDYTKLCV